VKYQTCLKFITVFTKGEAVRR